MEVKNTEEIQRFNQVFALAQQIRQLAGFDLLTPMQTVTRLKRETGMTISKTQLMAWENRLKPPIINPVMFSSAKDEKTYGKFYYFPQVKHQFIRFYRVGSGRPKGSKDSYKREKYGPRKNKI